MRINGYASCIDIKGYGVIRLGEGGYGGRHVTSLFVGTEEATHVVIIQFTEGDPRYVTFHNAQVSVEWVYRKDPDVEGQWIGPNLQSRTEWLVWIAEVLGHSQGLVAEGMEQDQRKFRKANGVEVFPPSAPIAPVVPVAPAEVRNTLPANQSISTHKAAADADAGGPLGFNMCGGEDPEVLAVEPYDDTPGDVIGPASPLGVRGMRVVRFPRLKGDGQDLCGKTMTVDGEIVRILRVMDDPLNEKFLLLTVQAID